MADGSRAVQELGRPPAGAWEIDPVHSHVGFVARHLAVTRVRGRFTEFSGYVRIEDAPTTSSVDVALAQTAAPRSETSYEAAS